MAFPTVCGPVRPVGLTLALYSGHLYAEVTINGKPASSLIFSSVSINPGSIFEAPSPQPHLHASSLAEKCFNWLMAIRVNTDFLK